MNANRKVSRREFVRLAGIAAGATALAACSTPTPQVIKETVVVEKPVEKVVEKLITPTAPPPIVTPHGRTLPEDAAPLDKQVFYESASEPKHLDLVRDLYSSSVALNWGAEPLLRLDENQEIVPALAESYKPGPNAEYWEFTIRKDAKWSDGVPITSDDWVFTFQHALKPEFANPWAWFYYDIKGALAYNQGKAGPDALGIEKVDDRTFRIYGEGPAPHIPAMMTYQAMVCAPKHRAEKDPEHWADTVEGFVSSGPFKLVKWEHNQRLEWEINPYYNGPHKPGVQKVVQLMGTPQTNWFNVWLNKEIDIMPILQPAELARVRSDPKLNPLLHWWTDPQTEFIIMDTHNPPFNNQKLRMALAKAIDREALCTKVMLGTTIPAQTMLPPDFPAYNPELEKVQAYDPEKAKQLLAEAGYPDGKDASGKQLELTFTSNGRDPKVEFVKEQWETNLGIKVNIEVLENAVWREKRSKREMKLFKSGYEYDYMDPANLLTQLWRSIDDIGSRQHLWKNEKFDELVTKAGTETDAQKRLQLFQEAERILVEDVGGIFLTHILIFQVWWPYITGIKPNRKGEVAYRYLDISRFQLYIRNDVDQWRKPH